MRGPFTPSLGGNLYIFYGVDHATRYIVNYGLRRKSEALAVFKRCVVDMAHKAGTAVKCVRGDCDVLWTSRGFVEFCDSMGIARELIFQKITSQPFFLVNRSWGDARPGLKG